MFFRDTYRIATKQLRRTSRRTRLTVLAVSFSIGFMVLLISLGAGLRELSIQRIATVSELARITVMADLGKSAVLTEQTIRRLQNIPGVTMIYPQIIVPGKAEYNDAIGNKTIIEGSVIGIQPDDFATKQFLTKIGKSFTQIADDEIIITEDALKAFSDMSGDHMIGETIQLSVSFPEILFPSLIEDNTTRPYRVAGIVETADETLQIYLPLERIASWTNGQYTRVAIEAAQTSQLAEISKRIESMGFKVTSLSGLVQNIDQVFLLAQLILGLFGSVALFVASIGLINTMTIALLERTREIGIMKAVGASNGDVRKLFLVESAMIGFWGGIWGIVGGVLIGEGLNMIARRILELTGTTDVERLFVAPVEFLIIIFALAILLSVLAGIYPAHQAARLNTAEALRYD